MLDLKVYDIVKINNVDTESVYLESVNSVNNKTKIAETDHFRVNLKNGDVVNDMGDDDDDKFEIRMAWRLDNESKDYKCIAETLRDLDKDLCQPKKQREMCANVPYDTYYESQMEIQKLERVVLQQAIEFSTMKQALEREESLKRAKGR